MMKLTPAAALAALLVLALTACSSSRKVEVDPAASTVITTSDAATATAAQPSITPALESSVAAPASEPSTAAVAGPSTASALEPSSDAAADTSSHSDEDKPGAGHVSMTGDYPLENDFVVEMCQAGPPGDGLLSGYHMAIKDGDPQIVMLSIGLKNYDKDGVYDVPSLSREGAVGQAMTSGTMGPLMLMVMKPGTTQPFGFSQAPTSKLTITVSDNGAKGSAAFTNLESQPDMSKFDMKSGKMPAGERASGSISWTCGTVGRIDPKMNDAVNGAFKTLIPR